MNYFAGLDVSLKRTAICIVDRDGNIVREGVTDTEPEALISWLRNTRFALQRIGLEAGQCSSWLHKGLSEGGLPVVCVETRHAKSVMQAQTVKTDRNDARALAQMMRTGWFKAVHIKSEDSQKLRALMGSRRCLIDKQRDLNNHIRAALRTFEFKMGLIGQSRFEERVRELIVADGDLQALVIPLLEARRMLGEQARVLTRPIGRLVRSDATCRRFMTVPGVGPLTALAFKTTIDNPGRFRKPRHVGVHLGLTPGKYASGEVDYNGRITRCGDAFAREHLFEAAHSLMVNTRRWCSLKAWGIRIAKRSSHEECVGRGGPQDIRHPALYVVRRQRLPVGEIGGRSGGLIPERTDQQNTAERLSRSPAGRGMARVITGLQREPIAP